MRGTLNAGSHAGIVTISALLVGWLGLAHVRGDDLVTPSGKTYRDARPVRVEPDGVTWRYAEGIVKVDFADSPKAVQETYHYDTAKAAAYHEARAQSQRQTDDEARQLVKTQEERQHVRAQAQVQSQTAATDPGSPNPTPPTLVYRHGLLPEVQAAARSLGEQMDARKARANLDARSSEGLGNPALWKYVPGVSPKPRLRIEDIPNSAECQANSRSSGDDFFNPFYMTKSYYEDTDRAAAFARGVPLK